MNPANTISYDGYTTLDLSVGYSDRVGSVRYRVYGRIDNALDETYATSVSAIGGQTVFAPGAPRTFSVGVQLDW